MRELPAVNVLILMSCECYCSVYLSHGALGCLYGIVLHFLIILIYILRLLINIGNKCKNSNTTLLILILLSNKQETFIVELP